MKRVLSAGSVRLVGLAALVTTWALPTPAWAQFGDLIKRLPRSANAIVLLNMEKAKQSPMGVREGWAKKVDKAFNSGLIRVPPQAARFVLASQIDLASMEPVWSAAVVDLADDLSLEQLAKLRGGTLDKLGDLSAVALPNDTYVVQFGPKVLGAMGPGNRQSVLRWIRETQGKGKTELSPYLQKAAGYSDNAGTEIIMAIDLEGALSWERVAKYLSAHKELLKPSDVELNKLASVLSGVQGVRLGVRVGDRPSGNLTIDFGQDASLLSPIAKPLLLQVLADGGMQIDDLDEWQPETAGTTVSLRGYLTTSGLQRVMAIVESPTSSEDTAPESAAKHSPGELQASRAKASLDHFHAVTGMADDLKKAMHNAPTLASTTLWFDKYAKRIERLPILNVDEELLQYSGFVASALRQAGGSVRTMGIQKGVAQAQITSSSAGYGYWGWGYSPRAEARGIASDRRAVRAELKGTMATDVHALRAQIIAATAEIRRKMTQKYQVEF
jgi:hypothetical protein